MIKFDKKKTASPKSALTALLKEEKKAEEEKARRKIAETQRRAKEVRNIKLENARIQREKMEEKRQRQEMIQLSSVLGSLVVPYSFPSSYSLAWQLTDQLKVNNKTHIHGIS